MSRIGRKPVDIPQGVDVRLDGSTVTVSKGKVTLSQTINPVFTVKVEDQKVLVERPNDEKETKALHGLYRALIHNMMVGVSEGFQKNLEVNGVGFRAAKQGSKLVLSLGYSHPVELEEPAGITIEVNGQNKIAVKGADKQLVGETAAKIRAFRVPDVYKGKGIKYDYEVLHLKEGKTGGKAK
ncbi:MAG: 50S ribosomal protein L6 [Oscillospiraceae bacterium]|nr:50S ribosomal protein L6 [Oscillospiraceae bacterium]MDD4367768.1 50S ribosomal protein L6 [Oscillospiraceae bacterium]